MVKSDEQSKIWRPEEYKPNWKRRIVFGTLLFAAAYTGIAMIAEKAVKNSKIAKAMNLIKTGEKVPHSSRFVYEHEGFTRTDYMFKSKTEKTPYGDPRIEFSIEYLDTHPKGPSEGDMLWLTKMKKEMVKVPGAENNKWVNPIIPVRRRRVARYRIKKVVGVPVIEDYSPKGYEDWGRKMVRPLHKEDRNIILSDLEKRVSQKGQAI